MGSSIFPLANRSVCTQPGTVAGSQASAGVLARATRRNAQGPPSGMAATGGGAPSGATPGVPGGVAPAPPVAVAAATTKDGPATTPTANAATQRGNVLPARTKE